MVLKSFFKMPVSTTHAKIEACVSKVRRQNVHVQWATAVITVKKVFLALISEFKN